MKKRLVALGLAVCMVAAGAVGCGTKKTEEKVETAKSSSTQKEEKKETELTKISVCEPTRGILWAPVYAAEALGYFEEEGLDVEITTVQSDMPTAPVLANEAQFGLYGPEMICKFVEEGQDTELIYTCTDTYPYSFFLGKDVTSVKDLKGKNVNGADSGSSPRAFVRSMKNSAVIAALESGEISATYASPELRAQLIEAGYEVSVDIYDKEVHKELLDSESYEMYIVFGKKSYIEQNPEITQAFVNACYKGAQYLENSSIEEIVKTLKELFAENDMLENAVKECKENSIWSTDGIFSDSGVQAINRMAMDSGLIKEPVDKGDLIDESFAVKAAEETK